MNILTNVLSTTLDAVKRRLTKVRVLGLNDIRTAFEAAPFGTDANPIKDMRAVYAETASKGDRVIVGYINKNQLALQGEHRLYSTDANGNLQTWIWMHNDGTIEIGGNANHFTQYEAMKAAFDLLKTDLNAARSALSLPPSIADMANAKTTTVKTL